MSRVGFRVACRGRAELSEVQGPDIEIGRDARCDLVIDHASIAPIHARILVRRGRVILAEAGSGKAAITLGRERLFAPVTLAGSDQVGLGDVRISAWVVADVDRSLVDRTIEGARVVEEIESGEATLRRYRACIGDGRGGEIAVLHHLPPPSRLGLFDLALDRWRERLARALEARRSRMARVVRFGHVDGRPYVLEIVPSGMRLRSLLDGIARRTVHLPIEALIVVFAHMADAIGDVHVEWGPHGALDPSRIHLGLDGSVTVIHPGPIPLSERPLEDVFLAPERRHGLEPSAAGDAFALGMLGKSMLGERADCPMRIRAICYWLGHAAPERRPQDLVEVAGELRAAALGAGFDPTFGHLARAVRLLAPHFARRLSTVSPRITPEGPIEREMPMSTSDSIG